MFTALCSMIATTVLMAANAQQSTRQVEVDGNSWTLTRYAEHCKDKGNAAIADYQSAPIYHQAREVSVDRYLVNSTTNCWVELTIEGIDDMSLLYKVSQKQVVMDRRLLSWWGLKVHPYPSEYDDLY